MKYADEKTNADWFAEMLRLSVLPEGYTYPKEQKTVRDLMRKRMQIVQQATQNFLSKPPILPFVITKPLKVIINDN